MTPVELTLADCRTCGERLHGCWEFAPDDLYCGLCGRRVFRLAFREDVIPSGETDPEVWVHAVAGGELVVQVWGLHGTGGTGGPLISIAPELGTPAGTARFAGAGFGDREFVLVAVPPPAPVATLAQPAPAPKPPWVAPKAATWRLKLTSQDGPLLLARIPVDGVPGQLVLNGPHGTARRARLLRLVPDPLVFDPPFADPPSELVGYYDEKNETEIRLTVTSKARVVVRAIRANQSELRDIRRLTFRGATPPCEFSPGRPVNLSLRLHADAATEAPQRLRLDWELAGYPDVQSYQCSVALRRRPRLALRPHGEFPEEVVLGGRPIECDLLLEPVAGGTAPELQAQPDLVLDPPEGQWLQADPLPVIPYLLGTTYPVRLTLDTARLDRAALDGRVLTATVRFTDQAESVWEHVIRVRAKRMVPDEGGVLGLDWGTTNTCAARADSSDAPPQPIGLPPPMWRNDPPDYEQFPSALYVESVTDPERPVLRLGPEARELANLRGHPECLIHSLKRRFFTGAPVYVRDEAGREHEYPVTDLARLVLLKLVELAEHELGREVRHLGFTFPTKWPGGVRQRFARLLERVAADLSAARPHARVGVRMAPPDIDEANAVALNVLQQLRFEDRLPVGRPFTLVAYDFGGGTIDTSVLQVLFDPGADPPLTTRYLGIGGTGDFGGDEVTRATADLLQERINRVLAAGSYALPVRRPGDPPEPAAGARRPADLQRELDGLKNGERLRQFAEEIKKALCRPAPDADPVREALATRLSQLVCHPTLPGEDTEPRSLDDLVRELFLVDREAFFEAVRFGLKEVYNHKRESGGNQFTVAERVRDTFLEIKAQLDDAGGLPADLIVLAGGGCRLPLVKGMIRDHLGPAPTGIVWDAPERLIYDPAFAKQRVAHGKAAYLLIARDIDDLARGLARSVEVLHRALVVMRSDGFGARAEVVVSVGELLHAPDRPHPFKLTQRHLKNESGRRYLRVAVSVWQNGRWVPVPLGHFNLDGTEGAPLPPLGGAEVEAELVLTRPTPDGVCGPVELLLRARTADGRAYGPFPFVPLGTAEELTARLQGEGG